MTEVEQPPQNGIDPTAGEEDENSKARPADIEQDMREMERRKRVEAIMGSKLFREELERIVDSAREGGAGASGILQHLSDIVGVPVNRVSNVFKSSSCMVPINDIRGVESMGYAKGEKILRCKLAATFRLLDLYGWTQGLGAQITARLKVDQEYFLVNPYGLLYHEITASSLNKVDMQGQIVEQGTTNFGVNKSHFVLHSVVHAARPDIRCAIYIGCSPVVAISSLKSGLLALTKDACVLGEISIHVYTGLFDEDERNRLVRNLGPNSKVMLLANHGALCCGETIEEAFFAACHIVQACETQLKLLPVGIDNLVLIPEESRKLIYEQSRRPPEDLEKKFAAITTDEDGAASSKEEPTPKIGSPPKWRVGGAEFEALMRMLDNAGYRTGYIYRHPLIKSDPPKPKNDVELPPAVSSLGYLLEEEELFRQGIWKKGDLRKGGDRSRWLNSPNVYQKVEVLETGTPDPKKITKWVAEGSPTHSTPVRIEDPLQFVPAGTTTKEFKRVQQQIKDNRRADLISAGPQSHILEGVTWDEANRIKDATVSQTGDHVVLMGAASKGIIQRGFQHNATVYKAPYAKNPFDNVTDDELNEYKRTVERKKKSIHGEYTDTDFSESEALNSMQAAGAHAHAKHAQSEPETEHQVIQIQTQQAPIPSQAEVVLSDETEIQETDPDTVKVQTSSEERKIDLVYDELDKENQNQNQGHTQNESVPASTSKCRRDLLSAFTNPNSTQNSCPSPCLHTQHVADLTQKPESLAPPKVLQGEFYSYAYGAGPLGRCCQPQICSVLLHALHSEHLQNMAYYRGSGNRSSATSSTGTNNTNESSTPRRPLQLANGLPPPYRTLSHFGFNSPRQPPRTEHRHLPGGAECIRYRPMQRVISYEEIFATPRYEQLCQFCFEQLLRLKPELQRRSAASSSGEEPEDLISGSGSYPATPRKLATLTELNDEEEFEEQLFERAPLTSVRCHVSTQTSSILMSSNFLAQIERLNFSEESTNVNYVPGIQTISSDISFRGVQTPTSPPASATSAPPSADMRRRSIPTDRDKTTTDLTEVWNFGNWQEQAQQNETAQAQQPLTERRITLEITQQFGANCEQNEVQATDHKELDQQAERQLMTREERQRRKLEFQELWQDHVQYFGAKEEMEHEVPATLERTVTMSLEAGEAQTLRTYGWLRQPIQGEDSKEKVQADLVCEELHIDQGSSSSDRQSTQSFSGDVQHQAAAEIPKILQDFEQSLCVAGQNLEKLVATTKKLRVVGVRDEFGSDESMESGSLFRAISLENIADADDTASVSEPQRFQQPNFSTDEEFPEQGEEPQAEIDHEEKRDDEKPVTPLPSVNHKDHVECGHIDEKDVDENEEYIDIGESDCRAEVSPSAEPTTKDEPATPHRECTSTENDIFSPLEREILERIQANKLKERESIFGRIDESIRNKLTPCKLQRMVTGAEETFQTCTHIYRSPPTATPTGGDIPHLFQFSSEPRPSSFSMHNINAPASSSAHVHVITAKTPRLSCSWESYQGSSRSSSPTSRPSLERTISSTTFVFRSSPRKKRNFIQENIRNAGKPRAISKSSINSPARLRRGLAKTSDALSVCTFQAEQRGSSARLWVSLPSTPRGISGQKRRSVSPNQVLYPLIHSSSTSYAKRRKPLANQTPTLNRSPRPILHKTISSSTYCTDSTGSQQGGVLMQNPSSTTFELANTEEDQIAATSLVLRSPENQNNATGSSLYYSADDNTVVEVQELNLVVLANQRNTTEQEMGRRMYDNESDEALQPRLSAGETTENTSQAATADNQEVSEVSDSTAEVYTGNTDEFTEPSQTTTDRPEEETMDPSSGNVETGTNDTDNESESENEPSAAAFQDPHANRNSNRLNRLEVTSTSSLPDGGESLNEDTAEMEEQMTDENSGRTGSQEFDASNESVNGVPDSDKTNVNGQAVPNAGDTAEPGAPANESNESKVKSAHKPAGNSEEELEGGSSGFSLSSNRANFNLSPQNNFLRSFSFYDSDSSTDGECLLKTQHDLQSSVQDDTEDDNKPNTSAAAATSKKKRKSGGRDDNASKKSDEDDIVVLDTQCTLTDGTLHLTDESLDDIQVPRGEAGDVNKAKLYQPFAENDSWNIFEVEGDEEEVEEDEEDEVNERQSDAFEPIAEIASMATDNMSPQNVEEFSIEVELPLGRLNEYGQLELELDTRLLFGGRSGYAAIDSHPIEWPLNGVYDFGPFVVELSDEQPELVPGSDSTQSLEVSQNEKNQAVALEQEIRTDLAQPEPKEEQPPSHE
ncbi:uncharacterized protein LOC115765126 isoform X1 [Drosophila novamexicana]|uniref:uncharacterized protein LOC115765126 isoform X1 n=1 Tax=Drosophila novamexicana TaxID=47314 RepID=UPI0011E5F6DD|nr:uncharacterized protein LOC115765126 isoform X1 [Drosophila novamexicana]XP_030564392.1 uncharacterized protein LOC115765126 isoform X1 [Drosophila novamexicana]XP_030564400.1 uncharacterized protein LOC115765126 isoform X1 [Drosophila novamexicana]